MNKWEGFQPFACRKREH